MKTFNNKIKILYAIILIIFTASYITLGILSIFSIKTNIKKYLSSKSYYSLMSDNSIKAGNNNCRFKIQIVNIDNNTIIKSYNDIIEYDLQSEILTGSLVIKDSDEKEKIIYLYNENYEIEISSYVVTD